MDVANIDLSADSNVPTAECLLDRISEVRRVLRRKGFSDNAIEHAVTVLYHVALPYVTGAKICEIKNRRAWAFKVAIQAAQRAANCEVTVNTIPEPAGLAATNNNQEPRDGSCDIAGVLNQLTEKQHAAVNLCILEGMSQREAAKELGIAVSTLCDRLCAAKKRLKKVLTPLMPPGRARL